MPDYSLGTAEGTIKIGYDGKGITQAGQGLDTLESKARNAQRGFQTVATVTGIAAGAIVGGIALAVNAAIDFEARISAIGAVSNATAEQLDAVRKKALQLGADTKFSASEAALAMEELVKAGLSVEDVMNGAADATVALAAAGEIALPEAAAIASNAMNQFNLTAAELPKIADLIAGAANASAITVSEFGFSLSQAGAIANLVGVNFDDLATAIALMGNQGIKGSDAGTALKTMLANLQPVTKRQVDTMRELGLVTADGANQFFTAEGKLKSLGEVSEVLKSSLVGLTDAQKTMALETIFGQDAIRAAATLAGEGAAGFNAMAAAMGEVTAQEVAAKRLDNVSGALEQLKGSVETAAIAFGTALLPTIRKVTEFITMLVNKFSSLDPKWQKLIAFAAVAAAALLGLVAVIATVAAVIAGLIAAFAAVKIGLIVGGIVVAIVAIAAAIKLAYDRSAEFRTLLGQMAQVAVAVFKAIMAGVRPIAEFFRDKIIPAIQEIAAKLQKNLAPAFKAIGEFMQKHVIPGVEKIRAALEKAMPSILKVAGLIIGPLKLAFEVLGKVLGFLIPILFKIIGPIFGALFTVIAAVIGFIPNLIDGFAKFINILKTVATVIAVIVIAPFWLLYQVGKFVFEQLMKVVETFVAGFMAVWNFLWPVTKAVWDLIVAIIQLAFAVISSMFEAFMAGVMAVWGLLWGFIIKPVVTGFGVVMNAIGAALGWIGDRISDFWNWVQGIWSKVHGWVVVPIVAAFNAIKDWIADRMAAVRSDIQAKWDAIVAFFTSARDRIVAIINNFTVIVDRVRAIFQQMKDAAIAKANEMVEWLTGLPGRIIGAIGNIGMSLYNSGRALIQGFWDGMRSVVDGMISWVSSKLSSIRNLLPFSPAKEGPFSGRGWVLYSGRALMEGFAEGIGQRAGMVRAAAERALAGVAGSLPTDFSATVGAAKSGVGAAAGFGGAGGSTTTTTSTVNEINLNVPLEDLRSIRDVQDLLDFIDRLRNDSRRGLEVNA